MLLGSQWTCSGTRGLAYTEGRATTFSRTSVHDILNRNPDMTDDTSKMQTVTRALSQAVGSRKPNGIWC
jgi:hypothetical protein